MTILVFRISAAWVGALWLIKRVRVDGWSEDKALAEARAIGLTSEPLRKFALDYLAHAPSPK